MSDEGLAPRNFRWLRCVVCRCECEYAARVQQCDECRRVYTLHIISDVDGELPKSSSLRLARARMYEHFNNARGQHGPTES